MIVRYLGNLAMLSMFGILMLCYGREMLEDMWEEMRALYNDIFHPPVTKKP